MNFNCEYEIFSDIHIECILKAIDEILCDEGDISLCCAMYHFMKKDASLKSEFSLMPPLIAKMADLSALMICLNNNIDI